MARENSFWAYIILSILASATLMVSTVHAAPSGNYLTLKYTANFDNSNHVQVFTVMGDVDDDGTQELIFAAGGNVFAINGKTGQVEWTAPESASTAVELVDLNNDGVPEILYGMPGPRVRALNGDGSIRWTSPYLKGESQAQYPLVAFDVDGDGYPTIYFASEDVTPDPYSGNPDDYTGALSMLDHNGNFLKDTWLYHPCWGGLALGDADFDGNFEVYVSDRNEGYHNTPSKGLQAYDAETLELLWNRGDMLHSSPLPVLADVNKDGVLDVIAEKIIHVGVGVLNATNGKTLPGFDYFNRNLPTHAAGTVYDIDRDGNLEIINSVDDSHTHPKDFVVFDLVTGQVDFHPYFDYWLALPPEVGDVTGDGVMEILAATGNQGGVENFPLLIYDEDFNLIQNITIIGAGQLMPAKVYDADSDGFNEVVVASFNGRLMVYDTPAPTPNPAPRTWVQRYSEYRRGAAEYVAPPGPSAPVIKKESPANNGENIPLGPKLSIFTYDLQNNLIDIKFEVNDGTGWSTVKTYTNVGRGTYTADTAGVVDEFGALYQWRVTTDDGQGHVNVKTFNFITALESPWKISGWSYRKQIVVDHTKVAGGLTNFPVLIDLTDSNVGVHAQADGDDLLFTSSDGQTKLSHEIETYVAANGHLIAWVRVPALSSTTDTILYMYYGNPGAASQENMEAVWDSNYLAVQHLEESSGAVLDSTSRNNDGTPLNGVLQNVNGKIDGGDQFDGVNDRTSLARVFTSESQFTMEGWMNSGNKQGYAISQWDTSNQGAFIQYTPADGTFQLFVNGNSIKKQATANAWHHVVATYDGNMARLFVDGATPVTLTTSAPVWPDQQLHLGDRQAGSRAFQGLLDEIRLSSVARSESYIKTSYNNQNNPSAFITIGTEEVASTKPIISNVNPAINAKNVNVTLSRLQFSLYDNNGDLMDYTVTTSPSIGSGSAANVAGGTYNVPISNLQYDTNYLWTITVTDGTETVVKTFNFKTKALIPPLLNDSKFDASVNSSDLWTNGPGQDWYDERGQNSSLISLNTNNIAGNTGKKARLSGGTNASTDNVYLSQEFSIEQTGNVSIEWDILVETILDAVPHRTAMMFVGDDSVGGRGPNAADSEKFVYMAFSSFNKTAGKMDLVARDRNDGFNEGLFTVVATDLNLGQWYKIRVDINLDADTYDVYVDGIKKATVTSKTIKSSVSHISFAHWNDGAGTFYVDNVREYSSTGILCTDADNDGYSTSIACGPIDCNDANSAINPGALDNTCNNINENCNGQVDEGYVTTPTSCGVGACQASGQMTCSLGIVSDSCIAGTPASEVCGNGIDDDCDGTVDESCPPPSSWLMPGWDYRKQIVVDHTKVAGGLTNFPVLIDLTDSNVGIHAQADGDDLLFTSSDGQTKLSHEIETYVAANGHLIAWVKVPALSSTTDTILYMYYGNPGAASQENMEAVWDSNYLAVQHLEESSGTVLDSTSRNNDGTPLNGVLQNVNGKIDGGDQFDGVNDRTSLARVFTSENQFTMEGWVYSGSKHGYAISQWDTSNQGAFMQYFPAEGNFQFYVNGVAIKKSSTANAWHHVVATYDGNMARLFVDGATPVTLTTDAPVWPDQQLYLGDRQAGSRALQGLLDEIRLSNVARSESYIKTSYNNQNNPAAFITIGTEESASG